MNFELVERGRQMRVRAARGIVGQVGQVGQVGLVRLVRRVVAGKNDIKIN